MDKIAEWLNALGCPYCRGQLQLEAESLHCPACGNRFPIKSGVPSLVRREDAAALANFSHRYRAARLKEGWRPMTPEQALALPYCSPFGYPPLYWEVRRQSYEALMGLLSRQGPPPEAGRGADLGAGTGWLTHRLAEAGYQMLAVETSLEEDWGLGAATVYLSSSLPPFLPIQGDLENPPLQRGRLSLVILNASLHYARDLEKTLQRLAETLQWDGRLVILDTPITRYRGSGKVPDDGQHPRHSLGRQELEDALMAAGLRPRWVPIQRGLRWWVYQTKKWLKRERRFSFPMIIADRLQ